jgi:N6-adenosine-specific RNA methylase IME4
MFRSSTAEKRRSKIGSTERRDERRAESTERDQEYDREKPRAARDVPAGTRWTFDHPTMAQVIAEGRFMPADAEERRVPFARHYGVILADPPWRFATYSHKGRGRSAEAYYDCMALSDIEALPVTGWAAADCALFLWATDPLLPQALKVIATWGFVYKTAAFTWVKTTKDGTGFPIGCGYWTRANPELCILVTRGRPQRLSRSVPQLIVAPRREHSRKPEEAYARIEALVGGPYLELFAREERPSWDNWGAETETGPSQRRWASHSCPECPEQPQSTSTSNIAALDRLSSTPKKRRPKQLALEL